VFDHVTIRVEDCEASERFYDTVLRTLGVEKTHSDEQFAEWDDFSLAQASDTRPVTRRLHIGFGAPLRADVDEFGRTGTEPATATPARPAGARGTPRATTAASCSTPTGTPSRSSTTTAGEAPAEPRWSPTW
jgi:catechol 2,3-dioxygenase-like lactoylglutathione lyase family enzyme